MLRIPVIALLGCFLFGLAGSYPIELLMRRQLRREMHTWIRTGARDREVVTFNFAFRDGRVADARLQWEEEDEFRLHDELYDVVNRDVRGDRIVLRCVPDGKESRLMARFTLLNARSPARSQEGARALAQCLGQHYLPQAELTSCMPPAIVTRSSAVEGASSLLPRPSTPPAPPPEAIAA